MNNTLVKRGIVSPLQMRPKIAPEHPIQTEINKNLGEITLTASFQEDKHTLETLKIPNLVSFLCILKKGQQIIAEGRGMSVLGRANKWIEKGISFARSQSLLDAVAKSTKVMEALQFSENGSKIALGEAYQSLEIEEPISDRQRDYLTQLISQNIEDSGERERWMSQIPSMNRSDASDAIQALLPDRE